MPPALSAESALAGRRSRTAWEIDIREVPHPEQLFLEGAEEPFDAAAAFRLADGGWRRHDAEESELGLKVVAHVMAAVVVARREPARHAGGCPPRSDPGHREDHSTRSITSWRCSNRSVPTAICAVGGTDTAQGRIRTLPSTSKTL